MLFLLTIADLIHHLYNNRSSIGMIGCFMAKLSTRLDFQSVVAWQEKNMLGTIFECLGECAPNYV